MSELKPAYLVWGDDESKLESWRRRLRKRAQAEGPSADLQVLKDEKLTADATAEALESLTLSVGRRYVLADGVERWKDRDVAPVESALAALPPETVVVFIAAGKPPTRVVQAVKKSGGEVHTCEAPKPAAYPGWVVERGRELGLALTRDAAQVLVERVGHNQQRLLRELEKLSTFAGPGGDGEGAAVGSEAVEALASSAVESRTYELADAVIEGDAVRALRHAEHLRAQGEDMMHILFSLLRALRNCHRGWVLTASGKSVSDVQSDLRVPPWVARRVVAQARRADGERIERAIDLLAELDYAIRGAGTLDPESALTLTLVRASEER